MAALSHTLLRARWVLVGLACCGAGLSSHVRAAPEPALYDTGPSRISGYVRFVNVGVLPLEIETGTARLRLPAIDDQRVSAFYTVPADELQRARMTGQGTREQIELKVSADEFVTVTVQAGGSYTVTREQPGDFNALKARIAFFNASPHCPQATLRVRASGAAIFRDVPAGGVAQRLVNPVRADVDAVCASGQAVSALDVGALAAARRYSLFLIPEGAHGSRLISVEDKKAGR